jgi:hypothetical protein
MERMTLSFPSIFDLHDFKKEIQIANAIARVNLLTGYFTLDQLQVAKIEYKAEIIEENPESASKPH